MMSNITIKDVAKAAGVSVATVSRVLNGSDAVSPKTAAGVDEVIKRMNYQPNFLGRNLRKCETKVILAIFPSGEYAYGLEIVKSMQATAAKFGYDIIMATSYDNSQNEMRLLNMLFNRTVDAAVLMSTHLNTEEINSIAEEYNIALCCERVNNAKALTVTVDDVSGGYTAALEFIRAGHRKIGMISTQNKALSSFDRETGYRMALSESGISFDESYIYRGMYGFDDGERAVDYFMSLPKPPTAIFAISDAIAMGAAKRAEERGIAVGEELCIIGYDDIPMCDNYIPSMSSIKQPAKEMGRVVIQKLVDNINAENKCIDHIILKHELIRRESFR